MVDSKSRAVALLGRTFTERKVRVGGVNLSEIFLSFIIGGGGGGSRCPADDAI